MDEERLQVLRLVERGQITPEQAAELLRALGAARGPAPTGDRTLAPYSTPTPGGPQWLRLRVTDGQGHSTADIRLPISVVRLGLTIGSRWVPQLRLLDPGWLIQRLRERAGQPVYTFKDAADGDRVVIWVE